MCKMTTRLVARPATCTGNKCFGTRNFRKAIAMAKADERHEWRVEDGCIGCGAPVRGGPELLLWRGERVRVRRPPSRPAEGGAGCGGALRCATAPKKRS